MSKSLPTLTSSIHSSTAASVPPKVSRRSGRPSRKEADLLDDIIMEAARLSFITVGFGATTIERVASQSGTTPRSVLHRFADKDALLYAVVDRWLSARLADILAPAAMHKEPVERLRAVCREMLLAAVTPHNYAIFRVLLGEVGRMPQMAELVIRSNDMFAVGLERIVLAAQESRKFRHYRAAAVATTAIGLMSSNPVNRAMLGDPQFHDKQRVDFYFSQTWDIILLMA